MNEKRLKAIKTSHLLPGWDDDCHGEPGCTICELIKVIEEPYNHGMKKMMYNQGWNEGWDKGQEWATDEREKLEKQVYTLTRRVWAHHRGNPSEAMAVCSECKLKNE